MSKTQELIDYIAKKGRARSNELDEHFELPAGRSSALLCPAVNRGELVSCKIEIPGKRAQNEYRIGSGAPIKGEHDKPAAFRIAAPKPEKPAAPKATQAPAAALSAAAKPTPAAETTLTVKAVGEPEVKVTIPSAPKTQPQPICTLDSMGRLSVVTARSTLLFTPAETREIGQFLVDTEPAWS